MPNPTTFAQYLECVGSGTRRARADWTADLDGYTDGFFLAWRFGSDDVRGFGDEQTVASMWRGATAAERTFHLYIEDHATEGHMVLEWEDSLGAIATETSDDMINEFFVNDTTVAWLGVSVRFDGGGAHTQWYFGEYERRPIWSTFGAESTDAGVIDMLTDSANDLTLGDSQESTGPEDQLDGRIFEYFQFSADFPNIDGSNLVAHFDGDDFTAGDGDTDTAVDSTGRTWTLEGPAADIIPAAPSVFVFLGGFDWPHFPCAILINQGGVGWDWTVEQGSLTMEDRLGERSTASLAAWDLQDGLSDQASSVIEGFPVQIIGPDHLPVFTGFVSVPRVTNTNPFDNSTRWELDLVDHHYLADKRLIADGWVDTTAGTIVTSIITQVLQEEGVEIGTIEAGPTLSEVVFNYVPCAQALDRLADMAGKIWWIDQERFLHFVTPTGTAVRTVDEDDMTDAPAVLHYSPDYRNKQYVRGIKGYTDDQTEDFEGDDTVQSFVTSYPIGRVPTVTLNAGAQTVGIRGIDTGDDWYWSKGSNVRSQETGDTPIGPSDALQVVYEGLTELVVVATDDAEQIRVAASEGGLSSGLVESVLSVTDIFGREAGFDQAAGLLDTYAVEGLAITFTTERSDYKVGDYVTVNIPTPGGPPPIVDEIFLVTAITSRDLTATEWIYDVTIVKGADAGSWQRRLAAGLLESDVLVIRENISENETLTILEQFPEAWGWAETDVTVSVFACPVPSTSLHPATSLLPC